MPSESIQKECPSIWGKLVGANFLAGGLHLLLTRARHKTWINSIRVPRATDKNKNSELIFGARHPWLCPLTEWICCLALQFIPSNLPVTNWITAKQIVIPSRSSSSSWRVVDHYRHHYISTNTHALQYHHQHRAITSRRVDTQRPGDRRQQIDEHWWNCVVINVTEYSYGGLDEPEQCSVGINRGVSYTGVNNQSINRLHDLELWKLIIIIIIISTCLTGCN